ncbi:MAG TPA: RNA polymerase sigma factor [Pirellulales bacterium]
MSADTEQSDLAHSAAGDGEAYARIVRKYQSQVARRMRSFARQPAVIEELVQEVFVDAYYGLRGYRGDGEFGAWLARIATRVGYRYWKKNRRREEVGRDDSWWRHVAQQEVEELDPTAAGQFIHNLLDRLPPRDRLVMLLIHVEGLSVEQAAQLAGWSKTMTKVQAFRARRKLRALLNELGIDNLRDACLSSEEAVHERT